MMGINTDRLMAYENGLLDEIDTIDLFQSLIDSGLIDHLQGHYGRTAARLIADGSCSPKGYVSVPADDDVYAMHGIDDGPNPDDFHPSAESGILEDELETNPETCDDWNRIIGRTSPIRHAIDASEVVRPSLPDTKHVGAIWAQEPE